ncbi:MULTISPECIES: SRPBCC family protein [unclassified Streptomyces]|uniref:SRPBCC family protein n=1 Tax=unclassified Streptomyces TaxID=2593676 RepID=UPI00035D4F80|nr:SRPBCC family protein [Streptomyces sp. BoleA5]MYX35286.1 SRPBCC family protein [Streptomyces sp. SID8377]
MIFRIERHSPLPAAETWRRVTDWERHAALVPLTTTVVTGERSFTARTGLGRASVDDPMEIVRWEPPDGGRPGRCRLEKRGRTVLGWAEIEVWPSEGGGSRVVWREDLRVRPLPAAFDRPTAWAGRLLFGRALDGLLARAHQ